MQVLIRGSVIGSDGFKSVECTVARKARTVSVPFSLTDLRLPEP
jgi:hypothetical protein